MKKINRLVFLLLFLTLFTTINSFAKEEKKQHRIKIFEINTTIMEIDLSNDFIIAGELTFNLMSHVEEGIKVFDTVFVAPDGSVLDPEQLKLKDRVVIAGNTNQANKKVAHSLTLVSQQ